MSRKRMAKCLALCALALAVCVGIAAALVISKNRQRAAEAAAAASAAAASEAAKAAEEEAARAASEAAEAARQKEERLAAEAAAAKRAEQVTAAQAEHDSVQYGDKLGRIWVEGTNVDCALYWGDSEGQFGRGAGCRAESDCVLPGENGTVFIGGHTGTYFSDLGSTQLGAIIHLETDWGDFAFRAALTSAPNVSKPGQSSIFAILHHPYTFYSSWTIGEMMQTAYMLNFIVHSLSIVFSGKSKYNRIWRCEHENLHYRR